MWIIQNLSSYNLDHLCFTVINVVMNLHNHCFSPLDYTSVSQQPEPLHYLIGYHFTDAVTEWCTIFQCKLIVFLFAFLAAKFASAPVTAIFISPIHKHGCITVVAETWIQHYSLEIWFDYLCCMFYVQHQSSQPSFLLSILMVVYLCFPENLIF